MTTTTVTVQAPPPEGLTFKDLVVGDAFALRSNPASIGVKVNLTAYFDLSKIGTTDIEIVRLQNAALNARVLRMGTLTITGVPE